MGFFDQIAKVRGKTELAKGVKQVFRRVRGAARALTMPLLVSALLVAALTAAALWQGRPVEFSFSIFHGVRFAAQSPVAASLPPAQSHPLEAPRTP